MKYRRFLRCAFLGLLVSCLSLNLASGIVLGDPLPASELQALNQYPSWVGTSCSSSSSSASASSSTPSTVDVRFLAAWANAESAGVKNYGSYADGITYTIQFLSQNNVQDIVTGLQDNDATAADTALSAFYTWDPSHTTANNILANLNTVNLAGTVPNLNGTTLSKWAGDVLSGLGIGTSQPVASGSSSCSCSSTSTSSTLPDLIPQPYGGAFTQGGNNNKVAPALVAAIFTEENFTDTPTAQLAARWQSFLTSHPDPNSGWPTSPNDAQGPFQFLPSTWTGLGYNINDINTLSIAADAAAKNLASNGGTVSTPPAGWQNAIFAYNHAQWYVDAVMEYYNFYTTSTSSTSPPPVAAPSSCGTSITCTSSTPTIQGLTTVQQSIVCGAKQELALWKHGNLAPGTNAYFKYSDGRSEAWCADFVSWIFNAAGDPFGPADSNGTSWDISYVPNLQAPPQDSTKFTFHTIESGYTPQPGDVAIHGSAHANIVISVNGSELTMIGGDQGGDNYRDNIVSEYTSTAAGGPQPITGYISPN
jgi:hypothetical protein